MAGIHLVCIDDGGSIVRVDDLLVTIISSTGKRRERGGVVRKRASDSCRAQPSLKTWSTSRSFCWWSDVTARRRQPDE